ncbi:adaptin N terminal region-domain-containing protein [Cokeromyces recurvatus]|uniref:adaptin N terminal region-domain-containing protein n=1 Tax=Cokeromyces recurvatus TaxID=90255 RepID=UPI00221FF2B5|nr:adaptin N terminal region-domain-containing protein [Cokeromyces recurvatus]KAI7902419.1 adaptin N terminal region-domain-containing protein [Cokeromyces recurvatus]
MRYNKRNEEAASEIGLFYHIDKTSVLQEARIFNDSHINARKCRILLTKIIYLLYTSEQLSVKEATDLFFNVIKLFQSKDTSLRQLMYLVIKELSGVAEDVIMVTQSLIKDIQSKQETIYRANAIRALCLITDPSMIQGIERILKACIVDKIPSVSSAALVSSYRLFDIARDVVKRWSNEVQEAVNQKSLTGSSFTSAASAYFTGGGHSTQSQQAIISTSNIHQYHAISLLYLIRQHDRIAVAKLVQTFSGIRQSSSFFGSSHSSSVLKSSSAICMLIRFSRKLIEDDRGSTRRVYDLLEGFLRHKSDMVNLEAARAICDMPDISLKELKPAIIVLQLFLSSPKATLRFAAIRTLNKLSIEIPAAVSPCNLDIETLVTDQNRTIATFAITTLLKTGNEASVDRLMKQISGFMGDISDEFKVIVIDAVRSLCLKFPSKQFIILTFLSSVLREEGGYDFKKSVVEAIFDMVKHIPECTEAALSYLCEFIEDCEFTKLSVRVLYLLGQEGYKTATPTKYIRYIYNRVILDNSIIRAAAVSALAKFGVHCNDPSVKKSVCILLKRCINDVDDEVRDRATLYLVTIDQEDITKKYLANDVTYALPTLEHQLVDYINSHDNTKKFNLNCIPIISKTQEQDYYRAHKSLLSNHKLKEGGKPFTDSEKGTNIPSSAAELSYHNQHTLYAEKLSSIAEFASFGALFKSSKPIELTERETEYVVNCVKHIFAKHIIFQFNCINTLNDQLLENVHMRMQPEIEGLVQVAEIPADKLEYNVPNTIYVAFEQGNIEELANVPFTNTLQFEVKDCDSMTGEADPEGYEDEYQVENTEVMTSDYIRPMYIANFSEQFESLVDNEVVETFALDKQIAPNLEVACLSIIDLLGMQALEDSEHPKNNNLHTLLLSGMFLDGSKVLCRCRMTFNALTGVTFELAVRSEDVNVSQTVLLAIS